MKIDWVILAEGVTQDARGAVALVGLGQNLLVTETLPAGTKRAVVTHLSDLPVDRELRFRVALTTPQGRVLSAQESSLRVGPPPFAGIPSAGLDIPIEFAVGVTEYGTHLFECELTDPEERITLSGSVEFIVATQSMLTPTDP